MTTDGQTQKTRNGDYVNAFSGLCEMHASSLAQYAAYWTDDANFAVETGESTSNETRFLVIQREVTNYRAECLRTCGRRA